MPEEHSHRAPKSLVFPANRQWKITGTSNSTNTSSGKGWMTLDRSKNTPLDGRIIVAIGMANGVTIGVAKQFAFSRTALSDQIHRPAAAVLRG